MKSKTIIYIIYIASIFGLCSYAAWNMSYNSAPDEFARELIANYFRDNLRFPHASDPAIRIPSWGFSYGSQPYIPQILSGIFMRFAWDQQSSLFFLRFPSVIFICAYSIFIILIANKIIKQIPYRWLFIVLCTMLPQILYIGSYVNNECMALMSSAMIVYGWIIAIRSKWSWKSCLFLGISMGVCLLSYYTAYAFLLCSAILYCINCYKEKIPFKIFLIKALFMIGIVFVLAGWFFIRNAILYDGDFFGLHIRDIDGELYADDALKPSTRSLSLGGAEVVNNMNIALIKWFPKTMISFIGFFGYMTVKLPIIIYVYYCLIIGLGILGFIISKKHMNEFKWMLIVSIIIPFILSFIYSFTQDYQPQGRYVITIAIPLFYFVCCGIKNICKRLKKQNAIIYSISLINYFLAAFIMIFIVCPL